MSELVLPVKDGKVVDTNTSAAGTASSSSKNELGKDAFLQLLVTQMKYQDPLNPNTDTEYVAQLATFSQLEQLQNLSSAAANTQALNLVGKTVVLKTENETGNTSYVTGRVDYITISGTNIQLSIDGKLYSFDQLDSVLSNDYVTELGLPGVETPVTLTYDADNPKDLSFTVNLGSGDTVADDVAVAIGEAAIDGSLIKLTGNTVTIDKSAFADLINGTYKLTVGFNDSLYTTVQDKVTLQVKNSEAAADDKDAGTGTDADTGA